MTSNLLVNVRSNISMNQQFDPSLCPIYLKLHWLDTKNPILADKVLVCITQVFHCQVAWYFFGVSIVKDCLFHFQNSFIVYKCKCQCDDEYMYRTNQRLETRSGQHVPATIYKIRQSLSFLQDNPEEHDAAIGEHLLDKLDCTDKYDHDFSLFYTRPTRSPFEVVYIKIHKLGLCKKKEHLFRSLCLVGGL